MKKSFGVYSSIWAICLAVFNVVVFVTPNEIGGVSKFSGSFWVGYIFITIAFFAQLACAFFAFKTKSLMKFLYNIPLLSISYAGLVAMLVVGSVFMAVPVLPECIGIVVCAIVLSVNVIATIKATAAAKIVGGIDEKVNAQTAFVENLSVDAQHLMTSTKDDLLHAQAKKVYEAIRYSDPVDNATFAELDLQIERQFNAFVDAVKSEDRELAKEIAEGFVEITDLRNQKCKLLK